MNAEIACAERHGLADSGSRDRYVEAHGSHSIATGCSEPRLDSSRLRLRIVIFVQPATQGVKVIQTAAADQVVSAIRTAEAEASDDDGADESENKTEQADAAAEE